MSNNIKHPFLEEAEKRNVCLDLTTQTPMWEHMFKKGNVRLGGRQSFINRADELEQIAEEVVKGKFSPDLHGFLCTSKGGGVARFVPVLSYKTAAVYFGCVRSFDEVCASHAVEGTYGGWTLGGRRRKNEESAAKGLFVPSSSIQDQSKTITSVPDVGSGITKAQASEPKVEGGVEEPESEVDADVSIPPSPYNKAAWVENWQEFWKVLAATSERAKPNEFIVSFDIANFYDCIDLDRLHSSLSAVAGSNTYPLQILFVLLKNWNHEIRSYIASSKGIPMDMIGDMSRVLANFYLVEFDHFFKERVNSAGGKYIRWADDMMFTCDSKKAAHALVYAASKKLHAMGLNINTAKVRIRTQEEFNHSWGFDVMDGLQRKENLEEGISILRDKWPDERYERKETALKRCVSMLQSRPELVAQRKWVYDTALTIPDIWLRLTHVQMKALLTISGDPANAATHLAASVMESPFTEPKTHLLRCLENQRTNADQTFGALYSSVRGALGESGHSVLEIAARYSPYEGERRKYFAE